jgi:predicted transcriptional regulator of viral defense system
MQKVAQALWRDILPSAPAFTTRQAAAAARVGVDQASRDLGRLARLDLIARVTRGVWADTRSPRFSPYAVVPPLLALSGPDSAGYVSLLSALSLHGMILQVPRVIHVVGSRRARRTRRTSVGTYRFHLMRRDLVGGFVLHESGTFSFATPAKALFDTLYLSVRKGARYAHLPEVVLPVGFRHSEMEGWIARIESAPLRVAVTRRWHATRLAAQRGRAANG